MIQKSVHRLLPIALWTLWICTPNSHAQESNGKSPSPLRLRILSYNIHHGEGIDGTIDLQRIAKVILAQTPDLVALQEVDNRTSRTDRVYQTEELKSLTRMYGLFARQIDYEGGEYGQAILSRNPISKLQIHTLPGSPARERRMAAEVESTFDGVTVRFASTHLHHARDDLRLEQANALKKLQTGESPPILIAGDLNAVPDSATIKTLSETWVPTTNESMFTFPSKEPQRQLDYVLVPKGWRLIEASVIDEPIASDHRPLLVIVEKELANLPVP